MAAVISFTRGMVSLLSSCTPDYRKDTVAALSLEARPYIYWFHFLGQPTTMDFFARRVNVNSCWLEQSVAIGSFYSVPLRKGLEGSRAEENASTRKHLQRPRPRTLSTIALTMHNVGCLRRLAYDWAYFPFL